MHDGEALGPGAEGDDGRCEHGVVDGETQARANAPSLAR